MVYILSIETSTDKCSVAVHENSQLKSIREIDEKGAHSEKLLALIEGVLNDAGISSSGLNAVAVSKGPGSYTGLRIGVSTAKGLAFALGIPLIGVDTLQALALMGLKNVSGGELVAMLDARRMEVYSEVFDGDLKLLRGLESEIIDADSFSEYLEKGPVFFVGDANSKVKEVIKHENAYFPHIELSAESVGQLAYEKYQKSEFEDLAYFVPNYLKEFKALQSKKNPLLP
ncbi:tRNA (adenosine(37)-N6)-threonylcarbamoyltransferase complex dimerization subunit type 1 TsaB [Algoriphagus sp. CAU 1675]|uniref:tRNA (adenosine(37)-N6)-threonylcarbamoyltransferase complex dimerization subunit type 1 TsaB n=1 Tax=Algoriphagus sp. CAU 1675 TaxID=3032597 RepID=UPI0023DA53AE|nr:tRNA (adenosine(37)-N6)-threonylcarbamoyltransferase complex dimerization subunit type 1 TsaB [Algoriphagus sp. CAU 1675]MDF2157006.1 tRNA (adenosine(37)-N6)-threonylcarbamoyltransferase complex dimerization subunit type 1 TsaB [Algoriphagus sp. CAU 1675]